MGIRVHKVIGYGIDDLQVEKMEIIDPRVDQARLDKLQRTVDDTDTIRWLRGNKAGLFAFQKRVDPRVSKRDDETEFKLLLHFAGEFENGKPRESWKLNYDNLVWQREFGDPKVMMFVPLGAGNWTRYDDIIDYYEERQEPRYRKLDSCGIYPYNAGMIRYRPAPKGAWKDEESEKKYAIMDGGFYNQLIGKWDPGKIPAIAKGEFLQHLLNDYHPVYPLELLAVLWFYREAFKDLDAFTRELRPMIYVYWA